MILSDLMFEPNKTEKWESIFKKIGAHYNIYTLQKHDLGLSALKECFPDAVANELSLVLFSTSGIHGTYNTIEDVEKAIENPESNGNLEVTFLLIQPKIVCLRYGNVKIETKEDLEYLKKLRQTSYDALIKIGKGR